MSHEKRTSRARSPKTIQTRLRLSMGLVVIVIIAVIVLVTRGRHAPEKMTMPETVVTVADSVEEFTIEPDNNEYTLDFSAYELQKDMVPEINRLFEQYFTAKKNCDVESFMQVFNEGLDDQAEQWRQSFEQQNQWIEDYLNISCYTKQGPEEDSYVVYTYFETKYKVAATSAPGLLRNYVRRAQAGNWYVYDGDMSPELEAYMEKVDATEDVRLLTAQVSDQLAIAVASDEDLQRMYAHLMENPDFEEGDGQEPEAETSGRDSGVSLVE